MQDTASKSGKNSRKNSGDLKPSILHISSDSLQFSNASETKSSKSTLPIPKGETPYALAKVAEYKDRDLDKAEYFYKLAIKKGERVMSAIKDLASLLHQRGKTSEALNILTSNRHIFRNDTEKYHNLYTTLQKQLTASINSLNKSLKMSNLTENMREKDVRALFENPVRIQAVEMRKEESRKNLNFCCFLRFNSHSSARKTLEGFKMWEKFKIEWVNSEGKTVGDAHYYRQKMEDYRKEHPTFDYQVFDRDPQGYVYCLPLDSSPLVINKQTSQQDSEVQELIGTGLFNTIFDEVECF
jgi:hypothetical protein